MCYLQTGHLQCSGHWRPNFPKPIRPKPPRGRHLAQHNTSGLNLRKEEEEEEEEEANVSRRGRFALGWGLEKTRGRTGREKKSMDKFATSDGIFPLSPFLLPPSLLVAAIFSALFFFSVAVDINLIWTSGGDSGIDLKGFVVPLFQFHMD
jgi:hypothetical protein